MSTTQIMALLKQRIGTIVMWGVLIAALSFLFVVVTQKNFKVTADLLIVQNQSGAQDFYSLSKSSEYLGKVLGEGIRSELFIDEVVKTGKVNPEFLPFDKKDKLEEWGKIVKVDNNLQLGVMEVKVFGNDKADTTGVAEAIAQVITTKNNLFRGEGQNVEIRVLSGPIVEKNPDFSGIALIIIGGFMVGILLSAAWIIYGPKKESNKFVLYSENGQGGSATIDFQQPAEPDEYEEGLEYLNR